MKYIIVSYIWDPSALPKYPRDHRRHDIDEPWEHTTDDFDRVDEMAVNDKEILKSFEAAEDGWLVQVDPQFEIKVAQLAHPAFSNANCQHSRCRFLVSIKAKSIPLYLVGRRPDSTCQK
jgi:hypothetical protein